MDKKGRKKREQKDRQTYRSTYQTLDVIDVSGEGKNVPIHNREAKKERLVEGVNKGPLRMIPSTKGQKMIWWTTGLL